MSWMLSFWVAAALLAFCRGQNTFYEAVNRSRDFSAKPGSCPTADGLDPKLEDCEWDMDCPGWQKCCQRLGRNFCSDAAVSKNTSESRRHRFNATMTVETDYQHLIAEDEQMRNHTRLLQAIVTGALQPDDVLVYYFDSWAVHPHRTATSLLLDCSATLPLYNVTSRMHLDLEHRPEVSAVTVEDLDECKEPALHHCSPLADCYNTVGSYKCICHQGHTDVDPSNPGANCIADIRVWTTTESPMTYFPLINTSYAATSNAAKNRRGSSAVGYFHSSEDSMTAPLSNTSSTTFNSSHAPHWTHSNSHANRSASLELPLPTATCSPPSITSLQSANVTGTSFCVHWFSQNQTNQTYSVFLSKGSEVIHFWKTSQTIMKMKGLQPGVLYNITVRPHACRSHGPALHILVRTEIPLLEKTPQLKLTTLPAFSTILFSKLKPLTNDPTITTSSPTTTHNTNATSLLTRSTHTENRTTTNTDATTSTPALTSATSTLPNAVTDMFANTRSAATSGALRKTSMLAAISVQCRVAAITVTVERDFLLDNYIMESALYLGLLECGVNGGNATHVELTVAWNECDTRLVHNDTYYTASVTLYNTNDSYISPSGTVETPRTRLEVPVMCTFKKSMLVSSEFGSIDYDMVKDIFSGVGSFQSTLELLNGTVPLSYNHSLSPQEEVVIEASVNTSSAYIKAIVNKCWATPTPNPADTNSYRFLDNSCPLNSYAKVLMNGKSSKSRVSVKIFSLVNLNVVYLHCQVQVCVQIVSDTCSINCLQRAARSSNTIGTASSSAGPLQRSEEQSSEQEYSTVYVVGLSCLGVGLSLVFIVGFVCLFYCQRNRIGHYNFSVKTKEENFTVLVFNA